MTRTFRRTLLGTLLTFSLILNAGCQDQTADFKEPADRTTKGGQRESDATKTTYSSASFARHVQISNYLDHDVLRPGDSFRIAVVFDIDDGWHIYGNPMGPGIGKATVVSSQAADGFDFEKARYAAGHRAEQDFGEAGKTWVWQQSGETVHFLSGKVAAATQPGTYRLVIEASAQVCAAGACLPGNAKIPLSVTIVTADTVSRPANNERFKNFGQARTP